MKRWIGIGLRAVAWFFFAWVMLAIGDEIVGLFNGRAEAEGDTTGHVIGLIVAEAVLAVAFFLLARVGRKKRRQTAKQVAATEQRAKTWTERDEALLQTIRTVGNYHRQRGDLVAPKPTVLALRYDDEAVIGQGPYDMVWWGKVGDGSWSTNGVVAVGTGAVGLGLVAGSLIGNSVAKSRAQARAAADATVTWRPVDRGMIHVSNYGFFLTNGAAGHRSFEWRHIVSAQIVTQGTIEFSAETDHGFQTWRIISDWSEAVFGLWALARNQQHPQWLDGSWYPSDTMRARLHYFGKSVDDATQSLPVRIGP